LVKPGEASPIYVPLRITRPGDAPETRRRYELVFFVPERVTVDSVQVTPEAGPKGSVVDQGACRARSGGTSSKDPLHITICMPPTAAAGVYSLVIFTKPAQAPIRFYHAPLQ
jgi:hypothetical protein